MASVGNGLAKASTARQQYVALLGKSSTFVKFVCISMCVGYCLSFSERAMRYLCVIPGNVLPPNFWIWTCVTHNFIEVSRFRNAESVPHNRLSARFLYELV